MVSDRCICLRKVEYSETSQILTLFGRNTGLLQVIAKGAHRQTKAGASKFDGGIDLLDLGNAVFTFDSSRDMHTLTEWKLRDGHLNLRKTLRGMYLALYAAELLNNLVEAHDPHPELFDRLRHTLPHLGGNRSEEVFLAFHLDLLRQSGHQVELETCVNCGQMPAPSCDTFYSSSRGGLICRNCEGVVRDRYRLDGRLLRIAQQVLRLPRTHGTPQRLPQLTRHQTDPLNSLLAKHIEFAVGKNLRMRPLVAGK